MPRNPLPKEPVLVPLELGYPSPPPHCTNRPTVAWKRGWTKLTSRLPLENYVFICVKDAVWVADWHAYLHVKDREEVYWMHIELPEPHHE